MTKPGGSTSDKPDSPAAKMRENIVRRAALEFKVGVIYPVSYPASGAFFGLYSNRIADDEKSFQILGWNVCQSGHWNANDGIQFYPRWYDSSLAI